MTVSFQLYSARNFQPWEDVIAMLAKAGYDAVEGYGDLYPDAPGFRDLLDRHGLTMPSGHFSIDALEDAPDAAIAVAKTLGMSAVYCPWLNEDQRPADAAGWKSLARRLAAIGARMNDAGLTFGWHNHDFEFATLAGGVTPMQILLEEAPEISWEADIAWIVRGGADPFDWIARHGKRLTAVHVKDIAPAGTADAEDGWADVGHGTVDWTALFAALDAGSPARLYIMEHDNPADVARFASRSIAWVKTKGL